MPDISMCTGVGCPLKYKCYRYTVKPDKYYQSYFGKPPYSEDGGCNYLMEDRREQDER